MAVPSEVRRVQAAIDNNNRKEMEWSLWYAKMRQSVSSARPADVKYWRAVEQQLQDILDPPAPNQTFRQKKKKSGERGLGMGPLPSEKKDAPASEKQEPDDA